MEMVAPHASVIVPKVLRSNNYKRWSIFMRHYLVGQDLWDVVQLSQLPAGGNMREWIKKSALAVHAIKISCGEEMFDKIKDMDSAKEVWDALANMHKPPVVSQEIAEHPLQRRTGFILFHSICFSFFYSLSFFCIRYWRHCCTFTTQTSGNIGGSEYETSESETSEYETLINAISNGNFGEVRDIIGRDRNNLLAKPDEDGKIPVQLAYSTIYEEMARYLYVATPPESRNGDSGFYILQECIIRKIFDIAFDILHHHPELASYSCSSNSIPLISTLAHIPPPLLKGSNLLFWERWIYDCQYCFSSSPRFLNL
ncbi:hypothetical protein SLEP1_g58681 [Rubroshorea leprosula]|uniref:DUF4219 domain-containing protein n=1 Tax=Rubroshorea leprosula TaxID=152421 RepID=A0AAV5MSJ2_9ROSI|nr:hypothetical protein SLEP1_g58681 [Rubroshorea leprosula]